MGRKRRRIWIGRGSADTRQGREQHAVGVIVATHEKKKLGYCTDKRCNEGERAFHINLPRYGIKSYLRKCVYNVESLLTFRYGNTPLI